MKTKITQRSIAIKAKIEPGTLCNYLQGERNARPAIAIRLEQLTGIDKSIWIFGTKRERLRAWSNFIDEHKENA